MCQQGAAGQTTPYGQTPGAAGQGGYRSGLPTTYGNNGQQYGGLFASPASAGMAGGSGLPSYGGGGSPFAGGGMAGGSGLPNFGGGGMGAGGMPGANPANYTPIAGWQPPTGAQASAGNVNYGGTLEQDRNMGSGQDMTGVQQAAYNPSGGPGGSPMGGGSVSNQTPLGGDPGYQPIGRLGYNGPMGGDGRPDGTTLGMGGSLGPAQSGMATAATPWLQPWQFGGGNYQPVPGGGGTQTSQQTALFGPQGIGNMGLLSSGAGNMFGAPNRGIANYGGMQTGAGGMQGAGGQGALSGGGGMAGGQGAANPYARFFGGNQAQMQANPWGGNPNWVTPPGGGAQPPPPPPPPGYDPGGGGGGGGGGNTGDLIRQWTYMSNQDPRRAQIEQQLQSQIPAGGNFGSLVNQYSAGGTGYDFGKSGDASTNAMLTGTDPYSVKWRAANPQWVAQAKAKLGIR